MIRAGTWLLFICWASQSLYGQSARLDLAGVVRSQNGERLPGITVVLENTALGTATDTTGFFRIVRVAPGAYTLVVTGVGYAGQRIALDLRTDKPPPPLDIRLGEAVGQMQEVTVRGARAETRTSRQPLAITTIDTRAFQAISTDAVEILNRNNGVRVRQAGGLGSEVNISIQGAQGNAVRRYYDGVPVRFLMRGFDISNLPINQVAQIDVYRGVTPLEVGTDALGGGINIVPKQPDSTFLELSYQVGSFNTHRASAHYFQALGERFFAGANTFYNYSDNNYPISAHDFNETTRQAENIIAVRRFHSAYRSVFGEVYAGVRHVKWADALQIGINYNDLYNEVQTGVVFNPVRPLGEVVETERGYTTRMTYRKGWRADRVQFTSKSYYGQFAQTVYDSTRRFYDWYGQVLATENNRFAELLGQPADIRLDRRVLLSRNTLIYQPAAAHKLTFSQLLIDQRRRGQDRFVAPAADVLRLPANLQQHYAGAAWDGRWGGDRLQTTLTYKSYLYRAEATSLEDVVQMTFVEQRTTRHYHGGNAALRYNVHPNAHLSGSYEYAYRLPEEVELFGNNTTIRSNIFLEPERGSNYNLGLFYRARVLGQALLAAEVNGFVRRQQDRIVLLASGFDLAQYFNEERVHVQGADVYISCEPFPFMRANLSATYQDVRIRSALVEADRDLIGTRVPNLPPLFGSADLTLEKRDWLREGDGLSLTYYYDFVDRFSAIREAEVFSNPANFIPTQHIHSLELTYRRAPERWSASLRFQNMFDDDLFDNFRVQRPGRLVNLKLRYVFS